MDAPGEQATATIRASSRVLWLARLVVLVAFLDLFMQFPVVASYAQSLGASAALVGTIVAAYSATNLVGNLAAGAVLDRWGCRRPILAGLLATAVILCGYAAARTPAQLLMARSLHGLTVATLAPGAFAMLGDSAAVDRRARAMGGTGALIAVAAVVGPAVAGVLREAVGAQAVFLLSAALMVVAAIVLWRMVDGRWVATSQTPGENRLAPRGFLIVVARRRLVAAYLAALALTVGLGTLVAHLPIFLASRGQSAAGSGLAFTVFAALATITMASPLNRLSDRYGRVGPMVAGLALVGAGTLILGVSQSMTIALAGMATFGGGFGALFPAMTALVAEAVRSGERGKAFGLFYAVYSLGVVIGSVVSGLLVQRLTESSGAPFFVGTAIALLSIPTMLMLWGRQERERLF